MFKKILIISSFCLGCAYSAFSQDGGRSLPFLEMNVDARTAGMGDANMGSTKQMFLYNNPTAFMHIDKNIYGSYNFTLYPSTDAGRNLFHAVSAGYKISDKHAVFAGARFINGNKITRIDESGIERKPIKPMDWSIDVGYSMKITNNFSAFVSGGFIQSYYTKVAHTVGFSIGAYYDNIIADKYKLTVGLDLKDMGPKFKYGKNGQKYNLPMSLGLGATCDFPINDENDINVALTTRYYFLPSNASSFTTGIGAEYAFKKMLFVRGGYHIGDNNNYATVGIGGKYKMVALDAAYIFASQKDFNILRIGVNLFF